MGRNVIDMAHSALLWMFINIKYTTTLKELHFDQSLPILEISNCGSKILLLRGDSVTLYSRIPRGMEVKHRPADVAATCSEHETMRGRSPKGPLGSSGLHYVCFSR